MATVLVYHANFGTMPGSWVALQIFFVLSGFLITNMLAGEARRNGRVSLTGFYARRAVRLAAPPRPRGGPTSPFTPPSSTSTIPRSEYGGTAWPRSSTTPTTARPWGTPRSSASSPRRGRSRSRSSSTSSGPSCSPSSCHEDGADWPTGWPRRGWCSAQPTAPGSCWPHHHFNGAVADRTYYAFDTRADALFFGCLLGLLAADGYFQSLAPMGMPAAHRGGGGGGRSPRMGAVHRPGVH